MLSKGSHDGWLSPVSGLSRPCPKDNAGPQKITDGSHTGVGTIPSSSDSTRRRVDGGIHASTPESGRSPALGTRHEVGSFGSMAGSTWSPSEPAREAEKTPREGSRFVDRLMPMAVHYGPWLSPAQGWGDMSIMPQGGLGGGSQPCCPCHVDTIRSGEKAEKTLRRGSRLVDRLAPMAVPYGPWWFGQLRAGAA